MGPCHVTTPMGPHEYGPKALDDPDVPCHRWFRWLCRKNSWENRGIIMEFPKGIRLERLDDWNGYYLRLIQLL